LEWAARQTGVSLSDVAPKISVKAANLIEAGRLTPAQAEKFAKLVNVPFGFLFFSTPPKDRPIPIADFRSVQDSEPLGKDFLDVYDDVVYKQSWYRDYLTAESASKLPFVGKFSGKSIKPKEFANDIRKTLDLSEERLRSVSTSDEAYSLLASCAENAGILVFKNGVVGNNTRRPLSVSQFRGFAISDSIAPAVFVNGADAKAAWQFTLAHELAHIWLGDTGISRAHPNADHKSEVLCNAVAAEFLVPMESFDKQWAQSGSLGALLAIEQLRKHFKVSALVIARRALDRGFITFHQYNEARNAKSGEGGGDFYRTLGARNGKRFSTMVAELAYSGEIGLREASRLLNTTPTNVMNLYERQKALLN
jgi:Zn-dependent peptidase ImmA (M78 family)